VLHVLELRQQHRLRLIRGSIGFDAKGVQWAPFVVV